MRSFLEKTFLNFFTSDKLDESEIVEYELCYWCRKPIEFLDSICKSCKNELKRIGREEMTKRHHGEGETKH